jgi:RNA-binding protein YhbY
MRILDNTLYILIEGEPTSPEVAFMNRVIETLKEQELLSNINYEVVEIGGSGNFNSISKLIYRKSKLHQSIPVIAISDRDFRTQEEIEQISRKVNADLIRNKSARIIYWKRHEWENFLLEETETIANLFNQISTKKTGEKKTYRKDTGNNLTKLPNLPNSLKELYCVNNNLTELPDLPNSLYFKCYNNPLTYPNYPDYTIKTINETNSRNRIIKRMKLFNRTCPDLCLVIDLCHSYPGKYISLSLRSNRG